MGVEGRQEAGFIALAFGIMCMPSTRLQHSTELENGDGGCIALAFALCACLCPCLV